MQDQIQSMFGHELSLYDILGVPPTASASQIKKAYFKAALKCHPDKCPGDEAAKNRFQALSSVHAVLSNPDLRSIYDETGEIGDDSENMGGMNGDDGWSDYWRMLFPRVTTAGISSFQQKYQGSDEERADVIAAYNDFNGDIMAVIDNVMLASSDDEDRFQAIIDYAIDSGEIAKKRKKTPKSQKARAQRKKKAEQEAKEAEEMLAEIMRKRHQENLSIVSHRRQQFTSMIDSLEEKYSSKEKKTKKKSGKNRQKHQEFEEPNEDEFKSIQERLMNNRNAGR
uniref:J domain-containing protein n=1 Tax=Fibrocapsa japonica TaxID=94617 RepID=A0A7S2Y545_9STRA|mmetsp:Transcript_9692/g.14898  ORF Transcript_9692/g.14898 Transcript_9692/m.14898 type:complete len:282 (+) Transcript_9692:110-955(+)